MAEMTTDRTMTECNAVALFENVSPSVYEASELLEDWLGGITWDSERNERLRAALLAVLNGVEANPHRLWQVPPLTFTEQQVEWLADVLTPRCCHTTGLHNPDHFVDQAFICADQWRDSAHRLVKQLGIEDRFTVESARPTEGCRSCERDAVRIAQVARIRKWIKDSQIDTTCTAGHGRMSFIYDYRGEGPHFVCDRPFYTGCTVRIAIPKEVYIDATVNSGEGDRSAGAVRGEDGNS